VSSPDHCEGDTVCFVDNQRFHFGTLVGSGYKWAQVRVAGTVKKVLLEDIKAWPPERITAPAKHVRRGTA